MKVLNKLIIGTLVSSTMCMASSHTPGTSLSSIDSEDRVLKRTVSGLQMFEIFNGKYGLSTDGYGADTGIEGTISAQIMPNSTIEKAYLYASGVGTSSYVNDVNFDGTVLDYADDKVWNGESYYTGREDITELVRNSIANGACDSSGHCDFKITENGYNDGEALVIVYKNNNLPDSTIAILDGHANMSGDSTILTLTDSIDKTKPGFFAHMYLGISYSYSDGNSYYQTSDIDVNGVSLTSNAGAQDDGYMENGGLITVGSFDDPFSPLNPSGSDDHEKYNLTPLLSDGDQSIKVDTYNSSKDDDIFLAIFHISQETQSVYIDGGPILTGLSNIFASKDENILLSYQVKNSATAPIDINVTLNNEYASFTSDSLSLINSSYDVNETKTIEVVLNIPTTYTGESFDLKLSANGNEINAVSNTKVFFKNDALFDNKTLVAGWNMLGASSDMSIEDIKESSKTQNFTTVLAFKYDVDGWKQYTDNDTLKSQINLPVMNSVSFERGFWIYLEPINN